MQNTMKATLVVNGKEFPIEINDPELVKLLKPNKKTGYERVEKDVEYFYTCSDASVESMKDYRDSNSNGDYNAANYYSDRTVAENNVRADTLMRKLRRFAVERREKDIEWAVLMQANFYIYYDHDLSEFEIAENDTYQTCGTIYFDSKATAELAIKEFKDELIWYFTEYKDSL